jgi:hypothetical protein
LVRAFVACPKNCPSQNPHFLKAQNLLKIRLPKIAPGPLQKEPFLGATETRTNQWSRCPLGKLWVRTDQVKPCVVGANNGENKSNGEKCKTDGGCLRPILSPHCHVISEAVFLGKNRLLLVEDLKAEYLTLIRPLDRRSDGRQF